MLAIILYVISLNSNANPGVTFYNQITNQWNWVFCDGFQIQLTSPPLWKSQLTAFFPQGITSTGAEITANYTKKFVITDLFKYGGKVAGEGTLGMFKAGGGTEMERKNETTNEVSTSSSRKINGKPVYSGVGVDLYTRLKGARKATYCTKFVWQANTGIWAPELIGATGPHVDGYIYNTYIDVANPATLSYSWFYNIAEFVPDVNTATGQAEVSFPANAWGVRTDGALYFKQGDSKADVTSQVTRTGNHMAVSTAVFTRLTTRNNNPAIPSTYLQLNSSNHTYTDNLLGGGSISTITFEKPTGALSFQTYNQVPYSSVTRVFQIVGGFLKMQVQGGETDPKAVIIDSKVEYTISGTDKYTLNGTFNGLEFKGPNISNPRRAGILNQLFLEPADWGLFKSN